MSLIDTARQTVGDTLRRHSIHKHRSRIGWQDAPRYTAYLKRARAAYAEDLPSLPTNLADAVSTFGKDGVTRFVTPATTTIADAMFARIKHREADGETLWADDDQERGQHNYNGNLWADFPEIETLFRGDLGAFLQNHFQAHFKILYGTLYRSVGSAAPRVGSQRWHSDSGPGICVNVMFYLHETKDVDGALEALPWDASQTIYDDEPAQLRARMGAQPGSDRRAVMADYYDDAISQRYPSRVIEGSGAAGLIVPFLNNTLHRGGYPAPGHERTAIVFHCYPSHLPTDFERYARNGIGKTIPYPKNPADEF